MNTQPTLSPYLKTLGVYNTICGLLLTALTMFSVLKVLHALIPSTLIKIKVIERDNQIIGDSGLICCAVAVEKCPVAYTAYTDEMVCRRPKVGASEAILSVLLTVPGFGITCINSHGHLYLLPRLAWFGRTRGQ